MPFKLLLIASLICGALVAGEQSALATPTDEVKKVVDEVVRIVSDKEMKKSKNEEARRQALEKPISSIFSYEEMAKRSLARHWQERSAAERKEFVGLFKTLLENSYSGKIETYNNEKIVYLRENVDQDYAEVKSKVITAKRDEFTLDYRLLRQGGKWWVYDVVIEGVSLVANYRSQFNKIISSQGYGELVRKLKAKSKEITAP